jgi:hypothetical protein
LIPNFVAAYIQDFLDLNEDQTFLTNSPSSSNLAKEIKDIDEKRDWKDSKKEVNFTKFNEIYTLIKDLECFRTVPYPETIVSSYESAAQYGLPLPNSSQAQSPGQISASNTVDYTGFVVSHVRDWAISFLVDDKILDKSN